MRNKGFMLFDTVTEINPLDGRPTGTRITNSSIGTVRSFSNLGTQTQSVAGIPFTAITEKIKIYATKYRLQKNCLAQDISGAWKVWAVLKPEDVVPRSPSLINLVLQHKADQSILNLAVDFYNNNKGGV